MNMMQFENESAADSIFFFISGIYLDNTVYKRSSVSDLGILGDSPGQTKHWLLMDI